LNLEYLTEVDTKLQNEVALLKIQIKEQQKIIYDLYKRIAELNEVHKRRNRE